MQLFLKFFFEKNERSLSVELHSFLYHCPYRSLVFSLRSSVSGLWSSVFGLQFPVFVRKCVVYVNNYFFTNRPVLRTPSLSMLSTT